MTIHPSFESQGTASSPSRFRLRLSLPFFGWLAALLLTFSPCPSLRAQASTGTVQGRIENSASGSYLNNVRVRVVGTDRETFTNDSGEYRFDNLPAGNVVLDAFYTGMAPQQTTITVTPGSAVTHDFNLRNDTTATSGTAEDAPITLGEFLVSTDRERNAAALAINEQRFAANIKNVVSTDAFGEINQGNIGEFVKHIPGVNIEFKDGNNPSGILIRGFGSNYTNVTMNGSSMASAAIANTQTPSRTFVLEQANINNIARIEVTKEPLPDTPANSLGGSVNLVTKSAFEYAHPQLIVNASGSANSYDFSTGKSAGPERGDEYKLLPSFDATYILPITKTLGIVVNGSEMNQFYQTLKSAPARIYTSAGATVTNPYTRSDGFSLAPNTVERSSGSIQVDWKPSAGNVFQLTALASAFRQDSAARSISYSVGSSNPIAWGETFTDGATTGASGSLGGTWQDRHALTRTIGGSYTFDQGPWEAQVAATYSNSNNRVRDTDKGFFTQTSTTLRNVKQINLTGIDNGTSSIYGVNALDGSGNTIDTTKVASYDLTSVVSQPLTTQDSLTEYRAYVKRDFDLPWLPFSVKIGGLSNKLVRDLHYNASTWNYVGPDGVAASGDETLAPFVDPLLSGSSPGYGLPAQQWSSPWAIYDAFKAHPNWFTRTPTQLGDDIKNFVTRSPLLMERLAAGYAMADAKFFHNRLRLTGGLRYESTEDEGWGYKQDSTAIYQKDASGIPIKVGGAFVLLPQLANTVSGGPEQNALIYQYRGTHNKRNYDGYFPDLSSTYSITDNLLLRAAYAKTIGRPSLSDIVPNISVSPNTGFDSTISGSVPGFISTSNTSLKPWTAKNYDLSLEYYLPHNGVISVGIFRKDITDFFATVTKIADVTLLQQLGLSNDYLGYQYSTRINGGNARVDGTEFNYSQELDFIPVVGRYFSVLGNYTHLSVTGNNSGAGTFNSFIPETGNAGLAFHKNKFAAGLYWNYRGRQIRSTSSAFPGAAEYIMPIQTYDGNVEYALTAHFSIFVAVRNLTNAVQKWALIGPAAPDWSYIENNFTNGRQYSFGVKGTF